LAFIYSNSDQDVVFTIIKPVFYKISVASAASVVPVVESSVIAPTTNNLIKTIFLDLCEIETCQDSVPIATATATTASTVTPISTAIPISTLTSTAVFAVEKSELPPKSTIESRVLKSQLKQLNAQCQVLPYTRDNCFNCLELGHRFKDCTYRFCRRFANGTGCQYGDKCGLAHLNI